MKEFNLSGWALKHQALVLYALLALILAGIFSYSQLSQKEDPDFTFRVMTIKLLWPGANAQEVEQHVTRLIENRLQETPWLESLDSYSRSGEAVIFITLKEAMPPTELSHSWGEVRKILADLHGDLPENIVGPTINDNFGETYGSIYALTSNTLSNAQLASEAGKLRNRLLRVDTVSKIELLGVQAEHIYIELSSRKMAELGINPLQVIATLKAQNAMEPAGELVTKFGTAPLRVSGDFQSVASIQAIGINAGGKIHRLGDLCRVYRSYADPASFKLRSMGKPAVGLAISMTPGGNVTKLGEKLAQEISIAKQPFPADMKIHHVADQPAVVEQSINTFMSALLEALAIVLLVSFLSLGLRAGLVVGLSIPLVLAGTFLLMHAFNIDLHRVSLGALIIALGLLVDDAMIAVEMMKVKLQQGWDKLDAATFAYSSTAFPMLSGTLITAAAFLPVGLAKSSAGEYTFSICVVVTIALLVSWVVAVIFTPFLGCHLLQHHRANEKLYQHGFYAHLRRLIAWCLDYRKSVIALTAVAFALALLGFSKVDQAFFPPSDRPELLMDLWLPEGSNFTDIEALSIELEDELAHDTGIINYTSYIGDSTPRFYLPLDLNLPNINYAQMVITTRDIKSREATLKRIRALLDADYPDMGIRISRLENGPPVGYPVQFRVLGEDPQKLRVIANEIADVVKQNTHTKNVSVDTNQTLTVANININQEKAGQLGLSSQAISQNLQALLSGLTVTSLRETGRPIDVIARAAPIERADPNYLKQINLYTENGKFTPLDQIATLSQGEEPSIIWHKNSQPVATVFADVPDEVSASDVSLSINKQLAAIRTTLPEGYRIEVGGVMEDSDKAQESIADVLPLMGFIIVTLLMLQLKNFKPVVLALLTAPLGIIGVTAALLIFDVPFGFVAMLGMISLSGMIMRNSVILLDQIAQDIEAGMNQWEAIVESTVRRFRPIMLTAAAAILAMIPLTRNIFWGPMAVVIMGGLLIATLLTLFYLPALYAVCFKVKRPDSDI